jgi:hypothetical protein
MFNVQKRDAKREINFDVTVKDYTKFKRELKAFSPALRKDMDREIRSTLQPISQRAKELVPSSVMRNWRKRPNAKSQDGWGNRIGFDQSEIKRGIAVRQGGKRARGKATSSAWRIINQKGAGVIFELAGSKTDGEGIAGRQFVENIRNVGGQKTSRLIWRAWDEKNGEQILTRDVKLIVEKYEKILQDSI